VKHSRRARKRPGPGAATGVEWVGALTSLPAYVSEEGEPYRPEALFWIGADGAVLGSTVGRPGEVLPGAGESLQTAMDQPIAGRPHRPGRVRVSSPELAEALRADHPGIDVICAPTPEVDGVLESMREQMARDDVGELSYLGLGIPPAAMEALFAAMADLFRAEPWKRLPDDQSLFLVTIEQLGLHDGALSVMGQLGESFGLILFSDPEDFETYLDAAEALEAGGEPELPPHFVLHFERGADVAPELRREISEHHWEVAGPDAYPWLVAIDEDLVARPPTPEEVTVAEALARALTAILSDTAAPVPGEPDVHAARTLRVATYRGEVEVTLSSPEASDPGSFDPALDVLAALAAVADADDDEVGEVARGILEEELLRRFAASPEGHDFPEADAAELLLDLTANYGGRSLPTLEAEELQALLFDVVPRMVSIPSSDAGPLFAELRAFYRFLKREFRLAQADACLDVLKEEAVPELEGALADPGNFGPATSLLMEDEDTDFDLESEEQLEALLDSMVGQRLPDASSSGPGRRAPSGDSRKAKKARKDRRKAARKARKRNR
jgi:hypothetical protein